MSEEKTVMDISTQEKNESKGKTDLSRRIRDAVTKLLAIIAFSFVFCVGLVIMFYPDISNYVNRKNQSRVMDSYIAAVNQQSGIDYAAYFDAAKRYNDSLYRRGARIRDAFASTLSQDNMDDEYWSLLSISGIDIIGYLTIDSIDVKVPLYHGTSETVLAVGAGHIQGSSLPIGGENTHTSVSAHTGLPSAKFFDKVDTLKIGDTFQFYIMNEILTYQVDQISVVLPDEVDALAIEPGKDYATLVTCTPYGINSHRLLVRGVRIETPPEQLKAAAATATQLEDLTWFGEAKSAIVETLAACVEFLAVVVVNLAQSVMDIFGVEY